jgi:putative ABC transport system substrate-binding protein
LVRASSQASRCSGGNITGFANIEFTIEGEWLELLKEMAPGVRRMALSFNPLTAPYYCIYLRELRAAPARFAAELAAAPVRDDAAIEEAIAALARELPANMGDLLSPTVREHGHQAFAQNRASAHYFRSSL